MVYAPIPYLLSPPGLGSYANTDIHWDYAIGGIPFLGAQSKDRPMIRKTADFKREQPDTSGEALDPGKVSIQSWWLESQSTFHAGTGQLYLDTPSAQSKDVAPLRFQDSEGVDVWTAGQFKLLNETYQLGPDLTGSLVGFWTTDKYVFACDNRHVYRYDLYGNRTTMWTSTEAPYIFSACTNGISWFALTRQGIYRGNLEATGSTKIYNGETTANWGTIHWVKERLIATYVMTASSPVYECLPNPGSPPIALPTPLYVHPEVGWEWWDACDAPGAILIGGGSDSKSTIYKFSLYQDGTTPTLTAGAIAAELPRGERMWNMNQYLGSMIGIVTSRGLRIGQFTGQGGDFQMGPLTIEYLSSSRHATVDYGRFVYTTYNRADGTTGLARVDLSQQLSIRQYNYVPDQRFAWAPDIRAMDGSGDPIQGDCGNVDVIGNRLVFHDRNKGIFIQDPNRYAKNGALKSSRIRMGTDDPKVFRYVRTSGEGTGTITVKVAAGAEALKTVGTISVPDATDSGNLLVSSPMANYATVHLTLTRTATNKTPVCFGYQLKALCAQKRQRSIQLPLSCFDYEMDVNGQQTGGLSTAYPRLRALEAIEEAGDLTTYQTLNPYTDQQETRLAVIDATQFVQTSMPTDEQGWGGYLLVTLRTVD